MGREALRLSIAASPKSLALLEPVLSDVLAAARCPRITSYNVCYTKLLRPRCHAADLAAPSAVWQRSVMPKTPSRVPLPPHRLAHPCKQSSTATQTPRRCRSIDNGCARGTETNTVTLRRSADTRHPSARVSVATLSASHAPTLMATPRSIKAACASSSNVAPLGFVVIVKKVTPVITSYSIHYTKLYECRLATRCYCRLVIPSVSNHSLRVSGRRRMPAHPARRRHSVM